MCRYILNTGSFMPGRDGALQKLKAHSNLTLALQKLRMPAKDLYEACNTALDLCHSDDVKADDMGDVLYLNLYTRLNLSKSHHNS